MTIKDLKKIIEEQMLDDNTVIQFEYVDSGDEYGLYAEVRNADHCRITKGKGNKIYMILG